MLHTTIALDSWLSTSSQIIDLVIPYGVYLTGPLNTGLLSGGLCGFTPRHGKHQLLSK